MEDNSSRREILMTLNNFKNLYIVPSIIQHVSSISVI